MWYLIAGLVSAVLFWIMILFVTRKATFKSLRILPIVWTNLVWILLWPILWLGNVVVYILYINGIVVLFSDEKEYCEDYVGCTIVRGLEYHDDEEEEEL